MIDKESRQILGSIRNIPSRYKEFLSGWAAGCVETCILYPKTKLIFRQQLHNFMIIEAFQQLKREGISLLYRGVLPPLIQRTTTRSIMFGAFENYQRLLQCTPGLSSFTACHAFAAFLAGATEASLCPLERTQVLLQTPDFHNRFRNTVEAFYVINKQHGLIEFYRGYSLMVLRNGLSNVIFFTLREPFRESVLWTCTKLRNQQINENANSFSTEQPPSPNKTETIAANFISGAILGACISTLFFPVNVIKNRIQSSLGGAFYSPLTILRIVWKERDAKIRALFRGAHLNFTRSLMTWGITNTVYEFLMNEVFI